MLHKGRDSEVGCSSIQNSPKYKRRHDEFSARHTGHIGSYSFKL